MNYTFFFVFFILFSHSLTLSHFHTFTLSLFHSLTFYIHFFFTTLYYFILFILLFAYIHKMDKESVYIDELIKSQRIASGNIYKLSLVFTGEFNRNKSFSEISDETSEVTVVDVVDNDNKDESGSRSTNQINQIVSTTVKSCIFCIQYGHWAKDCPLIPNKYRDCYF